MSVSAVQRGVNHLFQALDQRHLLLSWSATPTLSSHQLTVQFVLHKLYYPYAELSELDIEPRTIQFVDEMRYRLPYLDYEAK